MNDDLDLTIADHPKDVPLPAVPHRIAPATPRSPWVDLTGDEADALERRRRDNSYFASQTGKYGVDLGRAEE